ncbi:hypothetical protein BD289DRAFT_445553 [Coniella lustricola]|uniref:Ubiquitin carrier protein n=1 Tax=Coniella lustricola TaxID=2025994 RepID=A0A2T2ZUS7_9PEZI|nr:hypothetical protein BD289DRAFT_445553 [Coniella lustricola]
MVFQHMASLGGVLAKRAVDMSNGEIPGDDMAQLPGWAVLVFFADFLVFLPVFLYIGYTLTQIYPTLAIIEDPEPPAATYSAVSLNANEPSAVVDGADGVLITSSLRRTNRLLFSTAGWTANFRGYDCAIVASLAAGLCGVVFGPWVPRFLIMLIAGLSTVQLSAAWTHIVISMPSERRFWRRLPPFVKTFQATWLPITAYCVATEVTHLLPRLLLKLFGFSQWDFRNPTSVPNYSHHALWQSFLVVLVAIASTVLLMIPAHVILCRVQASFLPPDEDTIVPFDRSFGGVVEPAVVTGKGYVDFVTAWRTFSRESWIRLYKLLAKIALVTWAVYAVVLMIVVPELILMVQTARPADGL